MEDIRKLYEAFNCILYFRNLDKKGEFAQKLINIYSGKIDIVRELYKMELWLDSNPNKRKKNYKSFITRWFNSSEKVFKKGRGYNDSDGYSRRKSIIE